MAMAATIPLRADAQAMHTYLADYFGDHIHLVSIKPDGMKGDVRGQWFGHDAGRAVQWALNENGKGWNVYTTVNICKAGVNTKPKGGGTDMDDAGQIAGQRFIHVDLDPPKDGSPWSIDAVLANLAALRYPPSFVIFTGGGIAAFWRLEDIVVDKRTVTNVNRALAQLLGGDNCHNHDRLMRLVGTVNIPNAVKRARGRTEAMAYILQEDDGVIYPLHALAAEYQLAPDRLVGERKALEIGEISEIEPITSETLGLSPMHRLRRLIDHPKGKDRSADAYACASHMVRNRYSDTQILGVLLNPCNPVSAHIFDQTDHRRAAYRCIEGTRKALKREAEGEVLAAGISPKDFYAYMPMHNYIYVPTRETWPAISVNARLPEMPVIGPAGEAVLDSNNKPVLIKPSQWLDAHRHVEQMTWAPSEPMHIENRLLADGGWIHQVGASCFNLYRAPTIVKGDSRQAGRWLDHIRFVYPDEAEHLVRWFAHRVQRPGEKINHAIVLGGSQGVGKDTLLEPVKYAVGPWNFQEVSPQNLLGRFNGFVKSVILRVSEARDLGDVDRFAFYDHMKTYTAAPPDVLRVDEKNLREYVVPNVQGVIITTNHKADGIYLPADDRRHYVAWSERNRDDFSLSYWTDLWDWFGAGGNGHVAAYLSELDLSGFNPKAPPPKTAAFWSIVDASRSPEDAELADALEKMMNPKATTLLRIAESACEGFAMYLLDRRNARKIPHRLEECGYVAARNPAAQDGLWKVNGKRCAIYAQKALSLRDQLAAAEAVASARTPSSNTRF